MSFTMSQSSFFDRYPSFHQDHRAPILDEFRRLANQQCWFKKQHVWKWEKHRKECLREEFMFHFGSIEAGNKLAGWQGLCQELGVTGNISSIAKCKKALKRVHVNILDFIDDRRAGNNVETYRSAKALADHTKAHGRYFPKDSTTGESLMKILLKQIF
ncbi:MAG: hypothetical protein Q9184_006604 [Pyrenodesmia sp. 2 TL-2023]